MKLVTTYCNADLDGFGSCLAYAELLTLQGKDAEAVFYDPLQLEPDWLAKEFSIPFVQAQPPYKKYNDVTILDVSEPEILHSSISSDDVTEIIDHHLINKAELFKNAEIQIEKIGATATLVVERFIKAGFKPSSKIAIALYGGLASNTANFLSRLTTPRDLAAKKFLLEECRVDPSFTDKMFEVKSDLSNISLVDFLENDFVVKNCGGKTFCALQFEIINVNDFVKSRQDEIKETFNYFKEKYKMDILYYNFVDLKEGFNLTVTYCPYVIELFEKLFDTKFENNQKSFYPMYVGKDINLMIKSHFTS